MKQITFILNVPSFYKINFLNRLSEKFNITAIFLGTTDQVISDINLVNYKFKSIILSYDDMDKKLKGIGRIPHLLKAIRSTKSDYIVYGSWDSIDIIFTSFFTPKIKNCIITESSIFESYYSGLKGYIKRLIVSRYSKAFPSGKPHMALLEKLRFKGDIYMTGSVGVNNKFILNKTPYKSNIHFLRYLYIGRLINNKNVDLLVDVFNVTGKSLTIVGTGPLEEALRTKAKSNITFYGIASREEIQDILYAHNCLILPSKREAWGLVVEEALQCGLPVIASENVGSSQDLISEYDSGVIFKNNDKNSLMRALDIVEKDYHYFRSNALKIDFSKREQEYIESFVNALK